MKKKELDEANKSLEQVRAKIASFEQREAELEEAISEAETDEQKQAVEEAVEEFEAEKQEAETEQAELEERVSRIEEELSGIEAAQTPAEPEVVEPEEVKSEEVKAMNTRTKFFGMNHQERDQMFARDDVKSFMSEVRTCIQQKRALTNVGLLVPEVFIGLIRENILEFSKLYKHVNVQQIKGTGRMVVQGTIPEAVWTEACATLNELDLTFNAVEVDGYKVGGFFAVCNAKLEDSDIDLAADLITVLGQAIGYALDKAILYGTGTKMPLGIVTRLAQTSEPADYPPTSRTWVDLHTKNIETIAANKTGAELFSLIVAAFGAAKGKYSRGEKVFVMNDETYTALVAAAVSFDASGAIVAGINGTMPGVGGVIEVLDFVPDNVIIGGYFDLYLLAERSEVKIGQSEHVMFIEDNTVFKGTARYDGQPAIAEGFVAIGIEGTTPDAQMDFAPDTANGDSE